MDEREKNPTDDYERVRRQFGPCGECGRFFGDRGCNRFTIFPCDPPEPAVASPEPAVASPEPAVASPEPAVASPEPAAASPEPAATPSPEPPEVSDRTCNLCGLSCHLGNSGVPFELGGLIDAKVLGGYESTPGNGHGALDDGERYSFSLCEFCLDWLFAQFRVSVAVDYYMDDCCPRDGETVEEAFARNGGIVKPLREPLPPPPWRPAVVRVAADEWRGMKDEFRAEKRRRDAARSGGRCLCARCAKYDRCPNPAPAPGTDTSGYEGICADCSTDTRHLGYETACVDGSRGGCTGD